MGPRVSRLSLVDRLFSLGRLPSLGRLLLVGGLLLPYSTALADEEEAPPRVLARHLELANGWVHDAILPGTALDVAPFPGGGVAVLIVPEDGVRNAEGQIPRALYRIQGTESDITPILQGLPEHLDSLVGRADALWMGGEDRIYRWPATDHTAADRTAADHTPANLEAKDLEVLLEVEGVDLGVLRSRGLVTERAGTPVLIPEVGRLNRYAETADGLQALPAFDLPVRTRRRSRGFELWSPPVLSVYSGGSASSELWATQTEALGAQRLRALLIRPDAAEDERIQENWFRFESPEDVEQHRWVQIDGRPALIVATTPGDKLGIFQKLRLRIFYTGADRTRAGRKPSVSLETVSRRWYSVDPSIHEVTGDGKDDLILVQPEGMGGNDLVIDVFPGKGNGRFDDRRRRRTKLKDQGGDWHFGSDFNADGAPDLAVVAGGALKIYALDPGHKRKVLQEEPFFSLDRNSEKDRSTEVAITVSAGGGGTEVDTISARGRLRVFETDGHGRQELVLMRNVRGRAVIRVVSPKG